MAAFLILLLVLLVPAPAHAGNQGDDYEYRGGPTLPIERPRASRGRPDLCAAYTDTESRHACFRGQDSGKRLSAHFAGAKGWEAGYLRGFAWGMHEGIRETKVNPGEEAKGRAALESSTLVRDSLKKMVAEIQEQAAKAGYEHAVAQLDRAYNAKQPPVTTLKEGDGQAPKYSGPQSAYAKYVGSPFTAQSIMKDEMKLGSLDPFRLKDYKFIELTGEYNPWDYVFANGTYTLDVEPARNVDSAHEAYLKTVDRSTLNKREREVEDEVFRKSYALFVEYNFADQAYAALDSGLDQGITIGRSVGGRLAYHDAHRAAFEKKFASSAPKVYAIAWKKAFAQGFGKRIKELKEPIIEVPTLEIVGMDDDGILRPGEALKIVAVVDNKGLAPAEVSATLSGSVKGARPQPVDLKAFTQTRVDTSAVAKVDPALVPRTKATFTAQLDEKKVEVKREVRQIVEIGLAKVKTLETVKGRIVLRVGALNPSKVTAPKAVLLVDLGGKTLKKLPLGALAAGGKKAGAIKIGDIDPLKITEGKVVIDVRVVELGSKKTLHRRQVKVISGDPSRELLRHFDQLANGDGWMPKGSQREQRLAAARTVVVRYARGEIKGKEAGPDVWKDSPDVTLLGKLKQIRRTEAGPARSAHAKLVSDLCEAESAFSPLRRKKKKSYRRLCETLQAELN